MAYRGIAGSETNPEAPVTTSLMKALAENPVAIAEGDAGAPRIRTSALVAPAAGSTTIARWFGSNTYTTGTPSSLWADAGLGRAYVEGRNVGFMVLVPGRIRAMVDHRRAPSASGVTCQVRVLLNGSVVNTWSTSGDSFVARQADIDVVLGDIVSFQLRKEDVLPAGDAQWRNMRIASSSPNIAAI